MWCAVSTETDESIAVFKRVEHIFLKCVGGVNGLPKGWLRMM